VQNLPEPVRSKLPNHKIDKIAFKFPCPGATHVWRNHPLIVALSEYLLDQALRPHGDRTVAARCSVIRSGYVKLFTTLLLVRCRFLIRSSVADQPKAAEESLVTGFTGLAGSETWLSSGEALNLFDAVQPSANVSDAEKRHWLGTFLGPAVRITDQLAGIAESKAVELRESHDRLRGTIKSPRVFVEALIPPDVLAVTVILPQPRG
jgi:hypothetical protein